MPAGNVAGPQERRQEHRLLLAEPVPALERRGRAPVLAPGDLGRHVVADLVPHPVEEQPCRRGSLGVAGQRAGELADRGCVGLDHVGRAERLRGSG